jgi:hypothetical protein
MTIFLLVVIGGGRTIFISFGGPAGAGHIDDDLGGGLGLGQQRELLGVVVLLVFYGDAVEEKLGDVGHGDGVFSGDFLVGELGEEVGEELVYVGGIGQIGGVG